jgi:3-methyladenine DNA glycosylase/8-oxoguanine DNA glycosylase
MQSKPIAQRGRRDRYIEWVSEVPAAFVHRIRKATFLVDDPKLQLETLTSIPGIGPATAIVVGLSRTNERRSR